MMTYKYRFGFRPPEQMDKARYNEPKIAMSREIERLVAQGLTSREIAETLGLTIPSVNGILRRNQVKRLGTRARKKAAGVGV